MCEHQNSSSNLVIGVALGALIGAGVTFLFGTPKGREVRKKIHDSYPEFFDQFDEFADQLKDTLGDRYEDVAQEVEKIKNSVDEVVAQEKDQVEEIVSDKVNDLGSQMESLGVKLQSMSGNKPKRYFKRK